MRQILKPTKQKTRLKRVFGFDIETYDDNRSFLCASIYDLKNDCFYKFTSKRECIEFLKQKKFRDSYIVATNLGFDFWGLLFKEKEMKDFNILYRGSDLIFAKTYIDDKGHFRQKKPKKNCSWSTKPLTFIDTGNYARTSVEKLGNMLGIPKLKKPNFLGKKPSNIQEWEQMWEYNFRDSEISAKFFNELMIGFVSLGASPCPTIASTAMSLFKNRYLKDRYFQHDEEVMIEQFKGYYGGRCEAIKRGKIRDCNYYDINSLYPSVMRDKEFPDPNSLHMTYKNTDRYIKGFMGMSKVTVKVRKDIDLPILPHRTKTKLLFPVGTFTSWQTHEELKEALRREQIQILKVHKTYYYTKRCRPFTSYVNDLYSLRRRYQKEENGLMQFIVKLLLNSLYGKFGQKFTDREDLVPFNHTKEELDKLDNIEPIGDFLRIKKERVRPSAFITPIWAAYVTSYARLRLYRYLELYDPIYYDTDSIITKEEIATGKELGEMKLEMFVNNGIIVRPKMYGLVTEEKKEYVKTKGVGMKMSYSMFKDLITGEGITYKKFAKFKESIRRGFIPNELIEVTKNLSTEDEKRFWGRQFSITHLQDSLPIDIDNYSKNDLITIGSEQKSFSKEEKSIHAPIRQQS